MPFEEVRSSKIYPSPAPISMATVTSSTRLLHISGQVAQDTLGATVGPGDIEKQTLQVLKNIESLVVEKAGSLTDICKITVFLTSRDHLPTVMDVRRRFFTEPYPATSAVIVAGLANPEWMIEIEAMAALD